MVCGIAGADSPMDLIEHMFGHEFEELAFLAIAHIFGTEAKYNEYMDRYRSSLFYKAKCGGFVYNQFDSTYSADELGIGNRLEFV